MQIIETSPHVFDFIGTGCNIAYFLNLVHYSFPGASSATETEKGPAVASQPPVMFCSPTLSRHYAPKVKQGDVILGIESDFPEVLRARLGESDHVLLTAATRFIQP
jgi:hypothetical protein